MRSETTPTTSRARWGCPLSALTDSVNRPLLNLYMQRKRASIDRPSDAPTARTADVRPTALDFSSQVALEERRQPPLLARRSDAGHGIKTHYSDIRERRKSGAGTDVATIREEGLFCRGMASRLGGQESCTMWDAVHTALHPQGTLPPCIGGTCTSSEAARWR
jgi:hypothetical protein